MQYRTVAALADVDAGDWNALAGDDPFLSHAYLSALEATGCVGGKTGWTPRHLLLNEGSALVGALPLYLKDHSYGEYVFDWAWADAYYRAGHEYYPKLLSAVPFTPVTGRRLLAHTAEHRTALVTALLDVARQLKVSSAHVLFPTEGDHDVLLAAGLDARAGVQFHWQNDGYTDFDGFLAAFNHAKRKNIRQERRRVREAGISYRWREGTDIGADDWAFFAECYRNTYHAHGSRPYLNLAFFETLGRTLAGNVVLVIAYRDGERLAASFNVRTADRLYGRYWGCVESVPGLHFETCYYQVIEYCIARGIAVFEGGAQGEHKMARGLMPVATRSAHWLAHPQFAAAVQHFLEREGRGVAHYIDELRDHTPFRRADAD